MWLLSEDILYSTTVEGLSLRDAFDLGRASAFYHVARLSESRGPEERDALARAAYELTCAAPAVHYLHDGRWSGWVTPSVPCSACGASRLELSDGWLSCPVEDCVADGKQVYGSPS